MKVLYMGTPDFATAPLEALVKAGHTVVGVLTQPDKPKGRGMQMSCSPVKTCALELGIPVYQPETLRDRAILPLLEETQPDVIAVVAYGKLLPGYVLRFPKYGCINVHGSLLPKYRGAGPIQAAVINGDAVTGVTTMYMAKAMDTGDMILKAETPISQEDTAETVFDRLRDMGAELLVETLRQVEGGTAPRIAQNDAEATYAPMLSREDARIDWNLSAQAIYDRVRGMYPWPGAYTEAGNAIIKLFDFAKTDTVTSAVPGTVVRTGDDGMEIACGDGKTLRIARLQPPGKKPMEVKDYLRGNKLPDVLGVKNDG